MPTPRSRGKPPQRVLQAVWMPTQDEGESREWHLCDQAYIMNGEQKFGFTVRDTMEPMPMPVIDGAAIGGRCATFGAWCVPHVQPDVKATRGGPIQRRGVAYLTKVSPVILSHEGASHEVTIQPRAPSKGSDAASDGDIFESGRLGMALEKLLIERSDAASDGDMFESGRLGIALEKLLIERQTQLHGISPRASVSGSVEVVSEVDVNPKVPAAGGYECIFSKPLTTRKSLRLEGADGPTVREPRAVELRRLQDIPTLPIGCKDGCPPAVLSKATPAVAQSDIEAVLRKMPMPKLEAMPDD